MTGYTSTKVWTIQVTGTRIRRSVGRINVILVFVMNVSMVTIMIFTLQYKIQYYYGVTADFLSQSFTVTNVSRNCNLKIRTQYHHAWFELRRQNKGVYQGMSFIQIRVPLATSHTGCHIMLLK